jgi:hypothetical protein
MVAEDVLRKLGDKQLDILDSLSTEEGSRFIRVWRTWREAEIGLSADPIIASKAARAISQRGSMRPSD